jgi:hypothetical protein
MSPNLLKNNQIRPSIQNINLIIHWIFPYYEVSPWVKILAPPLDAIHNVRLSHITKGNSSRVFTERKSRRQTQGDRGERDDVGERESET